MNNFKGNIGEWSEIYTFLRLLGLKELYAADANVNKIDDVYYDIKSVVRIEPTGNYKYVVNKRNDTVSVINEDTNALISSYPCSEFAKAADSLYNELKKTHTSAFELPDSFRFLNKLKVNTIKSKSNNKADIHIEIHDINTGFETVQGFSIKSRLGSPSTLVNASKATNFVYLIEGNITDELVTCFNGMKLNFRDKFNLLFKEGCNIAFDSLNNSNFENNLLLIDSNLKNILSSMLECYYVQGVSTLKDSLYILNQDNPLGFDLSGGQPFYEYKLKKFLTDCALGMRPSAVWNGRADATGGYIIVREDGEVLCYHLFNRDEFEDYLLLNTKFETPSTSRHDFGNIYRNEDKYYIKLNLQIRFVK